MNTRTKEMITKIARLPDWPVATRRELRDGLPEARGRVVEVLTAEDLVTLITQIPAWVLSFTDDMGRVEMPAELGPVLSKLEGLTEQECAIILAFLMDTRERLRSRTAREEAPPMDLEKAA